MVEQERLKCPKFNSWCESQLCRDINSPLTHASRDIKNQMGGENYRFIKKVLTDKITSEGDALCVDLAPVVTQDETRICPSDVLEGELVSKLGIVLVVEAMRSVAQRCVDETVADLKAARARDDRAATS